MHCACCDAPLTPNGDNWGDLCPSCADLVSEAMDDDKGLSREAAIELVEEEIREAT